MLHSRVMGPEAPRTKRDERKHETREDLIRSAVQVFKDRGFQAATLSEIARESGYSTGAIYWHFGGKDQLFLAAFEKYALTRVGELSNIYERERDVGELPERARIFADHWMERQADDPGFVVVALEFFVHSLRHPELREALATRQAAVRLATGRMLTQEAEEAQVNFGLPAQEIATVLRELGVGLALAKLADPDVCRDGLYGDFVELFFRLILGEDPGSQSHLGGTES